MKVYFMYINFYIKNEASWANLFQVLYASMISTYSQGKSQGVNSSAKIDVWGVLL